jgi:hypothetical protein
MTKKELIRVEPSFSHHFVSLWSESPCMQVAVCDALQSSYRECTNNTNQAESPC